MANPQKENGYTAIANEIMEALVRYRIPGEQMQCLLFIIRKTYGFNKSEDAIAISQFHHATGIKKPSIVRALKQLKTKNIIISKKANAHTTTYRFNKRYDTWAPLAKKLTLAKELTAVSKRANKTPKSLAKVLPTKDSSKDNTKDSEIPYHIIIHRLNAKTGKHFKSTSRDTRALIKARWNEGFLIDAFFKVIDSRAYLWKSDAKMAEYLRPRTIFGPKFEGYLQSAPERKSTAVAGSKDGQAWRKNQKQAEEEWEASGQPGMPPRDQWRKAKTNGQTGQKEKGNERSPAGNHIDTP